MLRLLELHLQRVLEDATFGLPYWDWAADGDKTPSEQLASLSMEDLTRLADDLYGQVLKQH